MTRTDPIFELSTDLAYASNTFYFNHQLYRSGLVQYFQCRLVKPSQQRNEFVIGFKNARHGWDRHDAGDP